MLGIVIFIKVFWNRSRRISSILPEAIRQHLPTYRFCGRRKTLTDHLIYNFLLFFFFFLILSNQKRSWFTEYWSPVRKFSFFFLISASGCTKRRCWRIRRTGSAYKAGEMGCGKRATRQHRYINCFFFFVIIFLVSEEMRL